MRVLAAARRRPSPPLGTRRVRGWGLLFDRPTSSSRPRHLIERKREGNELRLFPLLLPFACSFWPSASATSHRLLRPLLAFLLSPFALLFLVFWHSLAGRQTAHIAKSEVAEIRHFVRLFILPSMSTSDSPPLDRQASQVSQASLRQMKRQEAKGGDVRKGNDASSSPGGELDQIVRRKKARVAACIVSFAAVEIGACVLSVERLAEDDEAPLVGVGSGDQEQDQIDSGVVEVSKRKKGLRNSPFAFPLFPSTWNAFARGQQRQSMGMTVRPPPE